MARYQIFVLGFLSDLMITVLAVLFLIVTRPLPTPPLPIQIEHVGTIYNRPLKPGETGKIWIKTTVREPVILETVLTLLDARHRMIASFPQQGPYAYPYEGNYYNYVFWIVPETVVSGNYELVIASTDYRGVRLPKQILVPVRIIAEPKPDPAYQE